MTQAARVEVEKVAGRPRIVSWLLDSLFGLEANRLSHCLLDREPVYKGIKVLPGIKLDPKTREHIVVIEDAGELAGPVALEAIGESQLWKTWREFHPPEPPQTVKDRRQKVRQLLDLYP